MALNSYFPNPAFNRNSLIRYVVPQFPPPSEWHKMSSHLKGMQPMLKPVENGSEATSIRKLRKPEKGVNFYVLPLKVSGDVVQNTYESYHVMLQQLRNQVPCASFALVGRLILFHDAVQDIAYSYSRLLRTLSVSYFAACGAQVKESFKAHFLFAGSFLAAAFFF